MLVLAVSTVQMLLEILQLFHIINCFLINKCRLFASRLFLIISDEVRKGFYYVWTRKL